MSLIEGIGDEVTQFFLILFTAIAAYAAWWSTNISEQRQVRTVLLLDRRRLPTRSILRVRVPSRQLSNHTETVTISEGTPSNSSTSIQTEESADSAVLTNISDSPQTTSAEPKSNSAPSVSQTTLEGTSSDQREESFEGANIDTVELEESDIIETMDADSQNELRQRRLAHFEGITAQGSASNTHQSNENQGAHSDLESIDNSEEPKTINVSQQKGDPKSPNDANDSITIKLKYINDDVKAVDGRLEELLGDFKRRHFVEEFNANKAVKLIFNGHVLKQDRHSLQSCGLFDNCVVHCLIHQKRPSVIEREGRDSNEPNSSLFSDSPFVRMTNINNNNQGIDWDLGNFLFALVSFILLAAWYFRYVYAHLYTVTATVGLIIITGVFSIVLLGAYFPDNELQDANLRIRVTRTEVQVQEQQAQ